jgi:ABC-2 type transport system permease protein
VSAPVPGRGVWRTIARREFVERARDKGFMVSTAITLIVLVGFIVAGSIIGGPTRYDVAVVGDESGDVGRQIVVTADALGVEVRVRTPADEDSAVEAVRDGTVDAALVQGDRIVVRSDPPQELTAVIQSVSIRARSQAALETAGLSPEQIAEALGQPPLPVRPLEPRDPQQDENSGIAFIGILVLYGQIFAYGYWVAAGVVEEKSSRVIEVLLAAVRPSQLLRGKILGIGLLGLCQLLLIGVVALAAALLLGTLEFPSGAFATVGLVLAWFVLGFFFYAGLFAVAGAIVTRQEDLQTTMTPLTIVIVASFFVGINAVSNPESTLAVVASLLPPSAPLVMPSRIVLGESGPVAALLSAGLSIAATIALVPLATRIYSRAVLRTSRVRIRQVLRADRA